MGLERGVMPCEEGAKLGGRGRSHILALDLLGLGLGVGVGLVDLLGSGLGLRVGVRARARLASGLRLELRQRLTSLTVAPPCARSLCCFLVISEGLVGLGWGLGLG